MYIMFSYIIEVTDYFNTINYTSINCQNNVTWLLNTSGIILLTLRVILNCLQIWFGVLPYSYIASKYCNRFLV